jgi:hypothetical protein
MTVEFDEDAYLAANPDVAAAVRRGDVVSGRRHFDEIGWNEGRALSPPIVDAEHIYDQDKLRSQHNHEFMNDPDFQAAYARGVLATQLDYGWHWRVHTGLWAAKCASKLQGDFVECGVAKGFLSSSIMKYLDWDSTGRIFYLLDTFSGIDERYVTPAELEGGVLAANKDQIAKGLYPTAPDLVVQNFSEWQNVKIIVGPVPETLDQIGATSIAYLHLDMNCAPPEIAAISHLWSRLVPGAFILLDDYAYYGYRQQKLAMDEFAKSKQIQVLSLPTGQGLMIRPPDAKPTPSRNRFTFFRRG